MPHEFLFLVAIFTVGLLKIIDCPKGSKAGFWEVVWVLCFIFAMFKYFEEFMVAGAIVTVVQYFKGRRNAA